MTSRRPYWCPKPILWEFNSFLIQTLFFWSNKLAQMLATRAETLQTYLHIGWCSLCLHQASNLIHCFCDRFAGVGDHGMFLAMNLDSRRILQRTLKQIGISLKTGGNIDIKEHLPVRLNYFLSTVQVESLFQFGFRQNLVQFSLKSTFEFMLRRSRPTIK